MPPLPSVVVWTPGIGPARTLGEAARGAGRADLAVLMPDIEVFGDWLERLQAAAHSDTAIASASAMLSGGRWAPSPLPDVGGLQDAAAAVAGRSGQLRPRISEPHAGCVLLRRTALDAAGTDDQGGSQAAELADFAERCSALGLGHVLADDVLAGGAPASPRDDEAQRLDARYRHRPAARELDERGESPLEHAVLLASRGLDKLSVTIDGRALGPGRGGTQVHAVELIAALGRTGRVALRIITPPDLDPGAQAAFEQIEDLTLLPYDVAANGGAAPTDIVHRPSQVFSPDDLALLLPLGRRIVVTHQDLIAYRIAGYQDSVDNWQRYRRVTRDTLAAADHVVFFSEHARQDAATDELIERSASSVVGIGVDHRVVAAEQRRPADLPDDGEPFLLCLGADLPHKNQAFAVALADELRGAHGFRGRLVFAGPITTGNPPAPPTTFRLGPVGEAEKAWLLERAAAVIYPTLYEGFGLIPFEAAAAGTPCLFAAQTALAEVLPPAAATLVPWDAAASARAAAALLAPGPEQTAHLEAVRAAATRYRWDATAHALLAVYEQALLAPATELHRAARERLILEHSLHITSRLLHESELERRADYGRHLAFREEIGDDGLGLVGPGGVLGPADQRALMAFLSKRVLRRPVLRLATAAYRITMRARRDRERRP